MLPCSSAAGGSWPRPNRIFALCALCLVLKKTIVLPPLQEHQAKFKHAQRFEFFHPLLQKTLVLQNEQILQERLQQEQVRIASSIKQQKDLPEGFGAEGQQRALLSSQACRALHISHF